MVELLVLVLSGAMVVLFVQLSDTRRRLRRTEEMLAQAGGRIGALQRRLDEPSGIQTPPMPPAPEASAPVAPSRPEPSYVPQPQTPVVTPSWPETAPERVPEMAKAEPGPSAVSAAAPETGPVASSPRMATRTWAVRFEEFFGQRLPIWAGGITLAIAGVLIVRYAIDAGIFQRVLTHSVQIGLGVLFGIGLIGGAEAAFRAQARLRDVRVPQALSGAGVATLYASVLLATNGYGLIGPVAGFVWLALITAAAVGLSLRFGAPSALLGLAGGLAAPALVGSTAPNVPLLATYLGLTIAGLAGVSRLQRWPWLGLAALIGGAGWSLWLVLATSALDVVDGLSVGGLILLMAFALPALALDGPRSTLSRLGSAIIGALQLALLVAHGGFVPLHWGLFALLSLAGQWLAWRDKSFALVPSVGLALSVLLLAIWPQPVAVWFVAVGLVLAAIHAVPLVWRMWAQGAGLQRAVELSGLALAVPVLAKGQFPPILDGALAALAATAAAIPAAAIALGWHSAARRGDARFAMLCGAVGLLLALALALALPGWAVPLGIAALAASGLVFGQLAGDLRVARVSAGFAVAGVLALMVTMPTEAELRHWASGPTEGMSLQVLLRWVGLTAMAVFFAVRAEGRWLRIGGQIGAGLLAYGTLAQMVPGRVLPLVPGFGGAALVLASQRLGWPRMAYGLASLVLVAACWAMWPLVLWSGPALVSVVGWPMAIARELGLEMVLTRLGLPALAMGAAIWHMRRTVPNGVRRAALLALGALAVITAHALYRMGFAQAFGTSFPSTGLGQRLLWEGLLLGGGWLALRVGHRALAAALAGAGMAHGVWYGLVLHNPLWADQAVGGWPVINGLVPLCALPALGYGLAGLALPAWRQRLGRAAQLAAMGLIGGFAWASLRQLFHGSLLTVPGVLPAENILRSLLLLGLAIGYLLWGIRARRHDWRIASLVLMLGAVGKVFVFDASGLGGLLRIGSFVALGFSLIGIGWLYSRQLAQGRQAVVEPE